MIPADTPASLPGELELAQYADKLEQLIAVLHQEHESLTNKDIAALKQCTESKHEILSELERRRDAMDADKTDNENLPGPDAGEGKARIKALLDQCRHLNEVNGAIIDISKQFNQRLLGIMLGDTAAGNIYDASGKTSPQLPAQTVARI